MRPRRRLPFLGLIVAIAAAAAYFTAGLPRPSAAPAGTFSFAVLGDAPYYMWEEIKYRLVFQDLKAHDLRLVLHVGDIFWRPCTDARYQQSLAWFNALPYPVIYTPGDNEWADCWTRPTGEFVPLERLARLRQLFYPPGRSLGGRPVNVVTQASQGPFREFVENVRWTYQGLMFATVHLVGSGNATHSFPGRTRQDDEAVVRRTAAATAWLQETFAEAAATGSAAVVIGFHANPSFEQPQDDPARQCYEPFLNALEVETERFGRPVLVAQGDDHIYTVDQPLIRRTTGRTLENLTRLQVPGSPHVGWVRVVVTPGARTSFTFEPRVVPRWKYW